MNLILYKIQKIKNKNTWSTKAHRLDKIKHNVKQRWKSTHENELITIGRLLLVNTAENQVVIKVYFLSWFLNESVLLDITTGGVSSIEKLHGWGIIEYNAREN